ncbi:MAG: SRPBCC family protein [Chitinophagaceae bacterium]
MPKIHITTFIEAPVDRVFDLSRNVDLHKKSMVKHKEEAVAGIQFGMVEIDDTVTWKGKHLFKTRFLRSKITAMKRPEMFIDEQLEGDFKLMKHEHHFKPCENGTIMIDLFHFETPYGTVGKIFNRAYFVRYMKRLLEQRNKMIKDFAESDKWKKLLNK